jgi:hypothetical protein
MKERWISGDFSEMRYRTLPFTPQDIELIHSGLAQRAAGTDVGMRLR